MTLDNVTFLMLWFMVMFVTLSSGILIIMYRVGCFKCEKKVGIGDITENIGKILGRNPSKPSGEQSSIEEVQSPEANAGKNPNPEQTERRASSMPGTGRIGQIGLDIVALSLGQGGQPPPVSASDMNERIMMQRQQRSFSGGNGQGQQQQRICVACGEPMGQDVDPSDDSHPACRDMDASFM